MFDIDEKITHGLGPVVPSDSLLHLERVYVQLRYLLLLDVYQKGNAELLGVGNVLGV